jgi:hypothetical protein
MPFLTLRGRFSVFIICGATSVSNAAHAQLIQQYFPTDIPGYTARFSPTVTERMIQQQQSPGVQVGDYVIHPNLSENFGYNSNVLATPDSGSAAEETNAALHVNSDWTRDAFAASFDVDDHRFLALPEANFTNWTAGLGGALTLGNDTATLAYSHLGLNLAATDLGVAAIEAPVPYAVNDARLSYLKLFSRFSLTPSFEFENFTFGQSGGATPVNYDSLNHDIESGALTTRYEFSPGNAAIGTMRVSVAQFSVAPSSNYTDVQGFVGLDFGGDGVIQYRALAGLEYRKFSHDAVATLDTPTFELDAIWTPTELDTITASGVRKLDDPTSPFAGGSTITDGRVELDHELRTNLFFRTYADAGQSQSEPSLADVASNNQTEFGLGASATWDVNRNLRGTLSYGYQSRLTSDAPASSVGSGNFSSNTIMLGVVLFE